MAENRKIRRSQYISPFGTGAIYDNGNESLMAVDISWVNEKNLAKIELDRLASKLGVTGFRMPRPYDPKKLYVSLPFYRFPRWLFCSNCRSLINRKKDSQTEQDIPTCKKCKNKKILTPMRFVAICNKGHLQDIDWAWWLHQASNTTNNNCQEDKDSENIQFKSIPGRGTGLASLEVSCKKCGGKRRVSEIYNKGLGQCGNRQPWESIPSEKCTEKLEPIQRGATNLYYPRIISALDIPLEKNADYANSVLIKKIEETDEFQILMDSNTKENDDVVKILVTLIGKKVPEAETNLIIQVYKNKKSVDLDSEPENLDQIDEKDILLEEWDVLTNAESSNDSDNFIAEEHNLKNSNSFGLEKLFNKIVLIKKLREVRVLTGFNRKLPSNENFVKVALDNKVNWMPACEVFGEGIFISLSSKEIDNWAKKNKEALSKRLSAMQNTYEKENLDFLPSPNAKFVLLHTLSHLLIRQLSFDCGYAGSSLQERIYCDESNMAGILIYTADADSEGSLGGLVRQGEPDQLIPTVISCLQKSTCCSSDPICKELQGQGMRGLNKAACHACTLLSETSCIAHNTILDRMLLIGDDNKGEFGFFNTIIKNYIEANNS